MEKVAFILIRSLFFEPIIASALPVAEIIRAEITFFALGMGRAAKRDLNSNLAGIVTDDHRTRIYLSMEKSSCSAGGLPLMNEVAGVWMWPSKKRIELGLGDPGSS